MPPWLRHRMWWTEQAASSGRGSSSNRSDLSRGAGSGGLDSPRELRLEGVGAPKRVRAEREFPTLAGSSIVGPLLSLAGPGGTASLALRCCWYSIAEPSLSLADRRAQHRRPIDAVGRRAFAGLPAGRRARGPCAERGRGGAGTRATPGRGRGPGRRGRGAVAGAHL